MKYNVGFTLVMKQLVHTAKGENVDNFVEKCITY